MSDSPAIDGVSSFAAGMFRRRDRREIPATGAYDLENCLPEPEASRRGGGEYVSSTALGTGLTWVWDGVLVAGPRTVIASREGFATVAADGTVTSIGGAGLSRPVMPVVFNGKLYLPGGVTYDGAAFGTAGKVADHYATAGGRLWACVGNRAYMSAIGADTWTEDDYHELPAGVSIIGAAGARSQLAIFTSEGVWLVSGTELDLTDDAGNVQQRLDLFSRDLILWDPAGIAGWEGGLVVPALDGVWLLGIGVDQASAPPPFRMVSDQIEVLYGKHVTAGRQPGGAIVYRGHYLLPVMTSAGVSDLLVCRLDRPGQPWVRFSGHGASIAAFAVRSAAGQHALLGAQRDSTSKLSRLRYFDTNPPATDADGSAFEWQIVTRDFTQQAQIRVLWSKLRLSYLLEGDGAPTISADYALEEPVLASTVLWGSEEWGHFDWSAGGGEVWTALTGAAPEDASGVPPKVWRVNRRAERIRFRLRSTVPSARASILTMEVFSLPTGKV